MIPILDTHQHLIDPALGAYSWTDGIPALAGKAFVHSDYTREIDGTGITGAIFVDSMPDRWNEEAAHIYQLAAQPGSMIRGVVATCRPEQEGFEKVLEGIAHPLLVGARRICHVEPDEFSQQRRFVENVRRLGPLGLTFDLCFLARQLPLAIELVKKCPEVSFILDHCGVPDIASGGRDPWCRHIRQLAELPNVACKISGLPAYCAPGQATVEVLRPWVEHAIECFGWERVVWGGDWPVCTIAGLLRTWVATSREIVKGASAAEQQNLFHDNATRLYRLHESL
jgi:predicted TIM-barrel fold metal-dependent hydrolase